MARIFRRGHLWWCWIHGERFIIACTDREAAETAARALERGAADPAHAASDSTSIDSGIRLFLDHQIEKGCSPTAMAIYAQGAERIAASLGGATTLSSVTPAVVDFYAERRAAEGVNQQTVTIELRILAAIFRLAKRRGEFVRDRLLH